MRRTRLALRSHSRIGKPRGGGSVSELAERFWCAGGKIPARFGDILDAGEAHDTHGQFAQGRHHMGTVLGIVTAYAALAPLSPDGRQQTYVLASVPMDWYPSVDPRSEAGKIVYRLRT